MVVVLVLADAELDGVALVEPGAPPFETVLVVTEPSEFVNVVV